jgi:hypothetical protein
LRRQRSHHFIGPDDVQRVNTTAESTGKTFQSRLASVAAVSPAIIKALINYVAGDIARIDLGRVMNSTQDAVTVRSTVREASLQPESKIHQPKRDRERALCTFYASHGTQEVGIALHGRQLLLQFLATASRCRLAPAPPRDH